MIKTSLLEVSIIEPRLKHSTIFDHFDALESGESFVIRNDHDPKPLYYQLIGERGNGFSWDYLEAGPEYWQVRIGKPSQQDTVETIGKIAAKDVRKAELLKQLGVDFCCGGKQTLKEAATSIGISEVALRDKLEEANTMSPSPASGLDYSTWDLDFLSDYIKNVHHKYVREKGPLLQQLTEKVSIVHGNQHPELAVLYTELSLFLANLYTHLDKEELQLFPATKNMSSLTKEQAKQLISALVYEHENTGYELKQLRKITNNYTLPADACHSYTYLFERIVAFEADLFQHIHLENNILFPKMITAYEQEFKA